MIGKSNQFDRDLDLENLDDSQLESLICMIADMGYCDAAEKLGVGEDEIHEIFRAAGIALRPSIVKRVAKLIEDGMTLAEIQTKRFSGAYTEEDNRYIARYYRRLGTLSKTARYFNSSTDHIKQACLKNGITEEEILSNAINMQYDMQRVAVLYNANHYKIFETAYIAAQYAIDHFHTKSKNANKVEDSIRASCKSDFKRAYGYKWCYEKDISLYQERMTIHTDEPEDRQILCGIYIVRNDVNEKVYVGKTTVSFKARWQDHRKTTYNDDMSDRLLYEAMCNIGFEHFTFHILEIIDESKPNEFFLAHEKKWIKHFNSIDPDFGYNMKKPSQNEQTDYANALLIMLELAQGKKRADIAKNHDVSNALISAMKMGNRNHITELDYPIKTPDDFLFEYKYQVLFRLLNNTQLSYDEISEILDMPLNSIADFNRGVASACEIFSEYNYPIRNSIPNRSSNKSHTGDHRFKQKENLRLKDIQYIHESKEQDDFLAEKFNLSQNDIREIKRNPNRCCKCGEIITYGFEKCCQCANKERQKLDIDRDTLAKLIYNHSFKEIGKMYQISDRGVAKRCKSLGLPYTQKLIKLGKTLGWTEFCDTFASNEEKYLAMTTNNHRSTTSDDEIVDMYENQRLCITEISRKSNKCIDTVRAVLKRNGIEIRTTLQNKPTSCVELGITENSVANMGRRLSKDGYAPNIKTESVIKHIRRVLDKEDKTYLGFHFKTI